MQTIPRRARVQSFIKVELYSEEQIKEKAPRMIQARDQGMAGMLGQYLTPLEHEILGGKGLGPSQTPECFKGLNAYERAEVFLQKVAQFRRPAYIMRDFSKFDAHIQVHLLQLEHRFYRQCFGTEMKILDQQLKNVCYTKNGIKYRTEGTRMSGDRNTGGGNSIINIAVTHACLDPLGIKFEFLCDGDDSVVILEAEDVEEACKSFDEVLPKCFGLKETREVTHLLNEVEFCHSKIFFQHDGTPIMVRNPHRILQNFHHCPLRVAGRDLQMRILGKAMCELVSNCGTPFELVARELVNKITNYTRVARFEDPTKAARFQDLKQSYRRLPIGNAQFAQYDQLFSLTEAEIRMMAEGMACLDMPAGREGGYPTLGWLDVEIAEIYRLNGAEDDMEKLLDQCEWPLDW